jgi:hypothetical protein
MLKTIQLFLFQDPYTVAQNFIDKHELPQSYLDEIAGFIFKNASKWNV